jgi:anti-sigma B factor antagonist
MEGLHAATSNHQAIKDIAVIKLGGYLDQSTAAENERVIDSLLSSKCYRIIVDLNEAEYISSAAWGIFISKIKELRDHGGDLKLARMKPDVFEVYQILEFFWILKSYDSINAAVDDFDKNIPPMP